MVRSLFQDVLLSSWRLTREVPRDTWHFVQSLIKLCPEFQNVPLYLISFSKELELAPSFQLCEYFFQKNETPFLKWIRAFSPGGEMNNSCCSKSTMTDSNFFWFLKKKDPAISLTDIYPKELKVGSQKDTCTLIFTAVLFTIGKRWKQLKCPPMDECINKMW